MTTRASSCGSTCRRMLTTVVPEPKNTVSPGSIISAAAAAMALSSVTVVSNALRLRRFHVKPAVVVQQVRPAAVASAS